MHLLDHTPLTKRGAASNGGTGLHLASLGYGDRWYQGDALRNADRRMNARVLEVLCTPDRPGEGVVGGLKVPARGTDILPVGAGDVSPQLSHRL